MKPPINGYVVLSRSIRFILSIMTTNIDRTAMAPTYTIGNIKPMESECSNVDTEDARKNKKMKHRTECIGLTHRIIHTTEKMDRLYGENNTQFMAIY